MPVKYDDDFVVRPGTKHQYTQEQIDEIVKSSEDFFHFCKHVTIIDPDGNEVCFGDVMWDFQREGLEHIINNRHFIGLWGRQVGKSSIVGIFALWYSIFNKNITIGIVSNKEKRAITLLKRMKKSYEKLPSWIKPGVVKWDEKTVTFENNTTILVSATTDDAFRGETIQCIAGESKVCFINDNDEIYYTSIQKATSSCINRYSTNIGDGEMRKIIDEKEYYIVYSTKNLINNKIYVGFHATDNLHDGYLGSGKALKSAIEKYGPENFKRKILRIFDSQEDAEKFERAIVTKQFINRQDTYNASIGGNVCILYGKTNGFYRKKHTDETKKKIQEKKLGQKHTRLTKDKIGKSSKRVWSDNNFRQMMSKKHKGRVFSEESRKKMSRAQKGKIVSEETRIKISKAKKLFHMNMSNSEYNEWYVKTYSKERNLKLSETMKRNGMSKLQREHILKLNKNPEKIRKTAEKHRGMKRSDEARRHISESKRGKPSPNIGKIYCYDPVTFEKRITTIDEIPIGWKRGFVPKCKF